MNEILTALAVSHSRNEEFKAQTKVFSDRTQAFMDRTEVMLDRLSNIVITHDERARRPLAPP